MWDVLPEVPRDYAVSPRDVHVWMRRLGATSDHLQAMMEILPPEERQRAGRFHFHADRERHMVGRALSRILLGRLLDIRPEEIQFRDSEAGKPSLIAAQNTADYQFNVSHSGELVLVAVAAGRAIGVDVERIRDDMELDAIAARFFSQRERADLASVSPDQRCGAFFACWSRKEAFIKATGAGLGRPLDAFDVSVRPDEPAMLRETRPDRAEAARWVIRDLDVGPDHRAAVAVEGSDWQLKTMNWCPGAARG
jgi:4'-phosphopantetheinyl transferase